MSTIPDNEGPSLAEDTLEGCVAIGRYIGKTPRQALYLCATNQLPAWQMLRRWHMRKSTYLARVTQLEQASVRTPAAPTQS